MNFFARLSLTVLVSCLLPLPVPAQTDSGVFGSTAFLPNGLWGKVYALPDTTTRLPDFDTLKALDNIYSKEINIPVRDWTAGFPGAAGRFEWFGIDYKSLFKPHRPGLYRFRLLSDDGSKLFIDEKLVIDNDGKHGAGSKDAEINLNTSEHAIRVQYFQGPRAQIALQLFATYQNGGEEIFPGRLFAVTTPLQKRSAPTAALLLVATVGLVLFFFLWRRRKKKETAKLA